MCGCPYRIIPKENTLILGSWWRRWLAIWPVIHSVKANALVKEAIDGGVVEELSGYERTRAEVKFGAENSRVDLLLENGSDQCFVEVKSVTLLLEGALGVFPDAVSERGRKHLRELIEMKSQGHRAVLFFCVQHSGIATVAPADLIDPRYGDTFREALAAGVEVLAYGAEYFTAGHCVGEGAAGA